MNIDHLHKFEEYLDRGLKKEASRSVRAFISSLDSEEEIYAWVWEYLPNLDKNRHSRIRHELFHEVIFPVLKAGYENGDFKSTLWLGKLSQNLYQAQKLHEELDWVTELGFYNKAYDIDPDNDDVRLLLLDSLVSWLQYTEHEWPVGILYGNNGATLEQCQEIAGEVQRVLSMDKKYQYSEFIKQYNKKLCQYRARLNK